MSTLRVKAKTFFEGPTLLEKQLCYHVFDVAGIFMKAVFRRMCFVSVMSQISAVVGEIIVFDLYGFWFWAA
jgi:hypothetical protein